MKTKRRNILHQTERKNDTMKRQPQIMIRAILVALALAFSISASAGTVTLWKGKGNGRGAEAQFSDNENGLQAGGRINLFQNNGQTFLFFEMWGNDPTSESCQTVIDQFGNEIRICTYTRRIYDYGWGLIPSNDVQFTSTSVDLQTTTGPDFSTTRCTTVVSNSVTTCAAGPAAVFDLTWTSNDLSSYSAKEIEQSIGSFKFKNKGEYEATSAYVNGTVNGRSLADAPGRLGDTKGDNIASQTVP
jgi:hypothetical protein